ncbi:hypothetical protein [Streptomyces sp. Root1310]|uniref:hypothetical protein n=1 Tax=Streptomyces sp. Root1310 TaxID=1736452 RepID=UPI00070CBB97|nr:hypothetical protein [Streptomyces sp. Root1310]KQX73158.1 hypothetical protein ASD48_39620 [Streptomyces sp. Root1310]
MRVFVSIAASLAGMGLILYSRTFARRVVSQDNVFGRANAAAGKSDVRWGPLGIGVFLIVIGVLAATGLVEV